jgi:ketosteroid isomerase-like protein
MTAVISAMIRAVSENLIEIVRSNYDAINRFDPDAVLSFVHPDVVVVDASRPDPTSDDGAWHGKEGWGRFLLDWAESFDEMQFEPVEISVIGDVVISEVLARGRGRGSGIPVENRRFHVVRFSDGKGVRFEVCSEREQAEEAARRSATEVEPRL